MLLQARAEGQGGRAPTSAASSSRRARLRAGRGSRPAAPPARAPSRASSRAAPPRGRAPSSSVLGKFDWARAIDFGSDGQKRGARGMPVKVRNVSGRWRALGHTGTSVLGQRSRRSSRARSPAPPASRARSPSRCWCTGHTVTLGGAARRAGTCAPGDGRKWQGVIYRASEHAGQEACAPRTPRLLVLDFLQEAGSRWSFSFMEASSGATHRGPKMSPAFFTPISSDRRMVAMTLTVLEAVAAARPRPRLPVLLINRNRPVLNLVRRSSAAGSSRGRTARACPGTP